MLRIIFLLLITSASFGQVLQETNGSRADNRNVFKLGFRLPQVCWVTGNPNLLNYSAFMSKGAMVYDTCAGKIKRWSGSAWISIQDSTSGGGGGSTEYVVSGLGIKVDSSGRAYTVNSDTASSVALSRQRAANTYALIGASPTGSGASPQVAYWSGASALTGSSNFAWNNTNKALYFDGVTPSAWDWTGANGMALEVPKASLWLYTDFAFLNSNVFFDGAYKRKATGTTSQLYMGSSGVLGFRNAATGSANSAITWTDRLNILSDGKVGINTAAPPALLSVNSASGNTNTGLKVTNTGTGIDVYAPIEMVNNASAISQVFLTSSNWTIANGARASGGGWANSGSGGFSFIAYNAASDITFHTNTAFAERLRIDQNGGVNIGGTADAAASSLLEITSTTKGLLPPRQTTAQRNAIASPAAGLSVYNSSLATNDVYTTAWYQQPNGLTGSGTLDFPSTGAHSSSDLTITVTGAADGDMVILGVPNASVTNESNYSAWVSAANTVTVRYNHYGSGTNNPASGTFKVYVIKN
jgi:hypothetical protein